MAELNIVLSVESTASRIVRLTWTAEQAASFDVMWKSSDPPGQDFGFLASTTAFEYTVGGLESNQTYSFYIRGWIGSQFFISNGLEMFISCGKGVVLSSDPPEGVPPCQLAVVGRCRMADMSNPVTGNVTNFAQDPTDLNSFYFLESFIAGDSTTDYRLWRFTWPATSELIATITSTGNRMQNFVTSRVPAIAYNPASGAYHYGVYFSNGTDFQHETVFIDVNLSTRVISKQTDFCFGITKMNWDGVIVGSFVTGGSLWFCSSGTQAMGVGGASYMVKKPAGSPTGAYIEVEAGASGFGHWSSIRDPGKYQFVGFAWRDLNYPSMVKPVSGNHPTLSDIISGGIPMNVIEDGDIRFRFVCDVSYRYFCSWDVQSNAFKTYVMQTLAAGTFTSNTFDLYKKVGYYLMAYCLGKSGKTLVVSKVFNAASISVSATRNLIIDTGINASIANCHWAYPYIFVFHYSGDLGQCVSKVCNGVA